MGVLSDNVIIGASAGGIVPSEHFSGVAYTGDTSVDRDITGVGFDPDFTWIKVRNQAYEHLLFDAVRGATKELRSNATNAEATNTSKLNAFITDGFTLGNGTTADLAVNGSGNTYMSWNWKANGSGVSNTDGSITSTVSANVDAGFSIVSYTGDGVISSTVGHGLNQKPQAIIWKKRSGTEAWINWFEAFGDNGYLQLNTTGAKSAAATWFMNDTAPTSSIITLGNGGTTNESGYTYIAYCFHSVEGFSKIGSYTGNGSSTGPTVSSLGFTPAFIMIKRTDSTGNWVMLDDVRDTSNPRTEYLLANSSGAEATGKDVDFNADSFQIKSTDTDVNANGGTYIYMTIAG